MTDEAEQLAGRLAALLSGTSVVLLDFDGPVCNLFANHPAQAVAARLPEIVAAHGATLPAAAQLAGTDTVLRSVADLNDPVLTRRVADELRDAEITAATSAAPTPGAADVLRAARDSGRRVAVVSNNAVEAVRTYLDSHNLASSVDLVTARYDDMNPHRLKPNTHLLDLALDSLGVPPSSAVFVGDSITDIQAGRAAGTPTIGYANKPGKRHAHLDAGAAVVIDTMATLTDALRAAARPS